MISGVSDINSSRGLIEYSTSSRSGNEKELLGRHKPNSRVAILMDREVDCKDLDYGMSCVRYGMLLVFIILFSLDC